MNAKIKYDSLGSIVRNYDHSMSLRRSPSARLRTGSATAAIRRSRPEHSEGSQVLRLRSFVTLRTPASRWISSA